MSFANAVAFILDWEKGLVDDPADPGGLTNYGIALNRHPELTAQQIRALTPQSAAAIYRGQQYWGAIHGDDLPEALELPMLDIAVLEGPGTAIRLLQSALGIAQDGAWGPQTAHACTIAAAASADNIVEALAAVRIVDLSSKAGWPHDGRGWAARAVAAAMRATSST